MIVVTIVVYKITFRALIMRCLMYNSEVSTAVLGSTQSQSSFLFPGCVGEICERGSECESGEGALLVLLPCSQQHRMPNTMLKL